MICGDFDIFKEVGKLIDNQIEKENEKLKLLNEKALRGLRGICKECKKYKTCGSRKGSHVYCWEWKYSERGGEECGRKLKEMIEKLKSNETTIA